MTFIVTNPLIYQPIRGPTVVGESLVQRPKKSLHSIWVGVTVV
jgi:hypothetical protein